MDSHIVFMDKNETITANFEEAYLEYSSIFFNDGYASVYVVIYSYQLYFTGNNGSFLSKHLYSTAGKNLTILYTYGLLHNATNALEYEQASAAHFAKTPKGTLVCVKENPPTHLLTNGTLQQTITLNLTKPVTNAVMFSNKVKVF